MSPMLACINFGWDLEHHRVLMLKYLSIATGTRIRLPYVNLAKSLKLSFRRRQLRGIKHMG